MTTVYKKTAGLQDTELHYCPGCSHGIVHKLIGEVMEELGIIDSTICVCPVGCSVFAGSYFACDAVEAAHGRAPAAATGIKRTHPDLSAPLKSSTPLCGARNSLPSLSTTPSMA